MAQPTQYQHNPPGELTRPGYTDSPLKRVTLTGQGSLSHPKPPAAIVLRGPLKPAPKPVGAPGASGTI